MDKLLIATNNQGKVHEFKSLLRGLAVELVAPGDLHLNLKVVEYGLTYRKNAEIKAVAYSRASGLPVLADDSGLEIDALQQGPGINSARYAGLMATDREKVDLLLRNLKNIPWEKRTARFRCALALAAPRSSVCPNGEVRFFEGECEGLIAPEPVGDKGFGYDPIFYFPEYGLTMAQLPEETKNRVSHRARAVQALRRYLGEP